MGYRSLNDAASVKYAGFRTALTPGETEIWYMKPEWFRQGIIGESPDPSNLPATHVLLGKVSCTDLETLYLAMQGENWSSNGEANTLIESLGLGHTSMSVGDVIVMGSRVYLCANIGFLDLHT